VVTVGLREPASANRPASVTHITTVSFISVDVLRPREFLARAVLSVSALPLVVTSSLAPSERALRRSPQTASALLGRCWSHDWVLVGGGGREERTKKHRYPNMVNSAQVSQTHTQTPAPTVVCWKFLGRHCALLRVHEPQFVIHGYYLNRNFGNYMLSPSSVPKNISEGASLPESYVDRCIIIKKLPDLTRWEPESPYVRSRSTHRNFCSVRLPPLHEV
jgi:hypothetical protein